MTKQRPAFLDRPAASAPDANALELFARVVAAGSFAQAARQLGITRAAVSARVAAIERQIGVPLFARTTRALGLTETGRRLAARARSVLEASDAARRTLRRGAREGLAGTLRVTSVPIFGQRVLAPLLSRFLAAHPLLRLELRLTHRRMDLLRDDVDVAFRLTSRPPEDAVAQAVMRFAIRAYAAPGLRLESPLALAGERCLIFGTPAVDELPTTWQRGAERLRVDLMPALVADDLGTLVAMACAGGGVVLAPDFCADAELHAGRLVDPLPGWTVLLSDSDQVQALTLPLALAPPAARELVRFVAAELARGGPAVSASVPVRAASGSRRSRAAPPAGSVHARRDRAA